MNICYILLRKRRQRIKVSSHIYSNSVSVRSIYSNIWRRFLIVCILSFTTMVVPYVNETNWQSGNRPGIYWPLVYMHRFNHVSLPTYFYDFLCAKIHEANMHNNCKQKQLKCVRSENPHPTPTPHDYPYYNSYRIPFILSKLDHQLLRYSSSK